MNLKRHIKILQEFLKNKGKVTTYGIDRTRN